MIASGSLRCLEIAAPVLDAAWRCFELTTYTTDAIGSSAAAALMRSHVVDAVLKAHNQRVASTCDCSRGRRGAWRRPRLANNFSRICVRRSPVSAERWTGFRGFKADRWDA